MARGEIASGVGPGPEQLSGVPAGGLGDRFSTGHARDLLHAIRPADRDDVGPGSAALLGLYHAEVRIREGRMAITAGGSRSVGF